MLKKRCHDVNECDDGRNGGCVENSQCINTQGSFVCSECIEGFVGNQTVGCHPHPGTCPDGTVCDGNAECVIRRGYSRYQCRCKVGFAGDGRTCGLDSDLDGWPDVNLRCSDPRCKAVCSPKINQKRLEINSKRSIFQMISYLSNEKLAITVCRTIAFTNYFLNTG